MSKYRRRQTHSCTGKITHTYIISIFCLLFQLNAILVSLTTCSHFHVFSHEVISMRMVSNQINKLFATHSSVVFLRASKLGLFLPHNPTTTPISLPETQNPRHGTLFLRSKFCERKLLSSALLSLFPASNTYAVP